MSTLLFLSKWNELKCLQGMDSSIGLFSKGKHGNFVDIWRKDFMDKIQAQIKMIVNQNSLILFLLDYNDDIIVMWLIWYHILWYYIFI